MLTDEGHEPFALRNIDECVGQRMNHLQYYFAAKGDLVRGLLAHAAAEYLLKTEDVLPEFQKLAQT